MAGIWLFGELFAGRSETYACLAGMVQIPCRTAFADAARSDEPGWQRMKDGPFGSAGACRWRQ